MKVRRCPATVTESSEVGSPANWFYSNSTVEDCGRSKFGTPVAPSFLRPGRQTERAPMTSGKLGAITVSFALLLLLGGCARIETSPTEDPTDGVQVASGTCSAPGGISLSIHNEKTKDFCVTGFSGTSWQLLNRVAKVEGSADYPDSFVCRIDGWPKQSDNDCSSSASDFGYWNFFVNNQSLEWELAMEGPATLRPTCGSAQAWVWVAGPWTEKVTPPSSKPKAFFCPD